MVTGGAGYIGSAVGQTLLERGHRVVVIDSLVEGHRQAVPMKAAFYQGELGDQALLGKLWTPTG